MGQSVKDQVVTALYRQVETTLYHYQIVSRCVSIFMYASIRDQVCGQVRDPVKALLAQETWEKG